MTNPADLPSGARPSSQLAKLIIDGQNLRSLTAGPQPDARNAFRKRYLAWHDELTRELSRLDDKMLVDQFESTRWQLVVGNRVSDDELVRTVLGDIEIKLERLRLLANEIDSRPPRSLPDPKTVGVAVYDANCLFSKHARILLLAFAVHGVVRARWSRRLLGETSSNLAEKLRGDSLEDFGRWMKAEMDLVREGLVEGYERWIAEVTLPDPNDAHVLAAAIEAGATLIVTSNLRDFPAEELRRFDIVACDPDTFALDCTNANPVIAARIVTDHPDPMRFLDGLANALPKCTSRLRELLS